MPNNACPQPPSDTNFLTTDDKVWVVFTYTGGNAGDTGYVEWFDPSGNVYITNTIQQTANGGSYCYYYFIAISGFPPAVEPGAWRVRLRWNQTQVFSLPFNISTPPSSPLVLGTDTTLPQATVGIPYAVTFSASGGRPPYRWSFSGSPPPGLALSSAGVLSGVPTEYGSYLMKLQLADSAGNTSDTDVGLGVAANGANVSNQVVTTQAPNTSSCVTPPAVTSFPTTDGTVYLYFDASVTAADSLSNNWLAPDGSVVAGDIWSQVSGNYCFIGASLNISNLPASQLGSWQARVYDNGNLSFSIPFTVTSGGPTITGLSPASATAGSPAFTLTVNGSGFAPGATVQWNGSPLDTTLVSATQLSADVPATLIGAPGSASVAVSSGGQLSSPVSFWIYSATQSSGPAGQLITTAVGTDWNFEGNGPALAVPLGKSYGVGVDASGYVYFTDNLNNVVGRFLPGGNITILAGNGIPGFSGDGGPGTSASLYFPGGVAVDSSGNVYFCDAGNYRVRKISPDGTIQTIAGNGVQGYAGDNGPALFAEVNTTHGILPLPDGSILFSDWGNNRVRKISPAGIISTFAGNGQGQYAGDGGPAQNASLLHPAGLSMDQAGNIFIADQNNGRVRKVAPSGVISSVGDVNGCPTGVAADGNGGVLVADPCLRLIRDFNANGTITHIGGNGTAQNEPSGEGGPATAASFDEWSIALASDKNLYISAPDYGRVYRISPAGIFDIVAGNGQYRASPSGTPASQATLDQNWGISFDAAGNLYIADSALNRIRRVDTKGTISTIAGTNRWGYQGDGGPATEAILNTPRGLRPDSIGNLYFADWGNNVIRRIDINGTITTVAGSGRAQYSGDGGSATSATLYAPGGVVADSAGNLYIADAGNNRVRKVDIHGMISTIAGTGQPGSLGDNGPAIQAQLNGPLDVAIDGSGNLFVAEYNGHRVREITPGGTITTVAGNGALRFGGDNGPATAASIAFPSAIEVAADGSIYIADTFNQRVRLVSPDGIITTVAGSGAYGFSGDGNLATLASFTDIRGVAVSPTGGIFISDSSNDRVREILASAPSASVSVAQLQFTASSGGAPTQPQTLSLTSSVQGLPFSISVPSSATWLHVNPTSGVAPRLIQVTADPTGLAPNTYQATITINTPYANPMSSTVAVTFKVTSLVPAALSIDKSSLSFPFPEHGSSRSQTVMVLNNGSGALQFAAAPTTSTGGPWLTVFPTSGQTTPGAPATLTVNANPAGLAPGAYSGQLAISAGTQTQTVAVTMTISTLDQAILLSQSGLSFLAVQGGGVVPSQSFGVQNIGTGGVSWTASTSTLPAGLHWLQVSPASGNSDANASASPRVTVSVNAAELNAGTYYGLVRVDAPGAANTPQVLTVFLQILPPNAVVAPVVQPSHLLFTAAAGGESPGSQLVQVYNIVPRAKSFQSQVNADSGLSLLTLPGDATLDPGQPTNIVVQPITSGLSSGVYNATLTLQFSDGSISAVQVSVIVSNAGGTSSSAVPSQARPADSGTGCTPNKLLPALTTLGQTFTVSAGWPTALFVNVDDNCGNPMSPTGAVTVTFSNGDAQLSLRSQGAGAWENTWQTGNAQTGVTLTIHAANQGITGDQVVAGNLASQQQPPAFSNAGITSAVVALAYNALAPGSAITIYGNRLAESTQPATELPLPPQLVDTQIFITGTTPGGSSTGLIPMPLYYVSQTQVNALVPYEVGVDTNLQLLVQRGLTYSTPVHIDMAQAQPAVLAASLSSGSPGRIVVYPKGGGTPFLVSPNTPAHAGDSIVLFCEGLGAVDPPVADGAAGLGQPLSNTVGTVQVTMGGQTTQATFAGLAPTFAGLYQVNVVVPSGTQTGTAVPLTVTIDGQTSPPVTIPIQ